MDIWLYLVIWALVLSALDILSTIIGLSLKRVYGRKCGIPIIEQNKFMAQFLGRSWQEALFGYTFVTEQKLLYVLGSHLLIIYVSPYFSPILCIIIGLYFTIVFLNALTVVVAIKNIVRWNKRDKKMADMTELGMVLAEVFDPANRDDTLKPAHITDKQAERLEHTVTKRSFE